MARVNVMIQEEILAEVDQAAEEENLSHSGLLQKVARRYLEIRRVEKEANERKQRMEKAAAKMDRLADKFGKWDGVRAIRQFREQRIGAKQ